MLTFLRSSISLVQADIVSVEETIGYNLPVDFKKQYLNSNGGIASKNYFYVEADEGCVEISFFIPIKYPSERLGNMEIITTWNNLVAKGLIKNYLPFAVDWGGNYFALDLISGNIVLLLMDMGELTDSTIKYLANDFLHFVDNLEEDDV